MIENITWLGHASFKIAGSKLIYIDPWKIDEQSAADLILISHSHYDHFSKGDIAKVRGPNGRIITVSELGDDIGGNVHVLAPGEKVTVDEVIIEAVAAYNIGKEFHPKANGWIGFIVEMDGERLYFAGDTDRIPEMDNIGSIDVALLPVGGTYTMDATEAAAAANAIKPKVAVPYHWGDIVGSRRDAEAFALQFHGKTVILEPGRVGS